MAHPVWVQILQRADVFSLGVLLFEVTTRTRLYSAQSNTVAMKQILDGEVADPAERRPGYPAELTAIVRKALARDPDARYQTARALVDELDQLAHARKWGMSKQAIGDIVTHRNRNLARMPWWGFRGGAGTPRLRGRRRLAVTSPPSPVRIDPTAPRVYSAGAGSAEPIGPGFIGWNSGRAGE